MRAAALLIVTLAGLVTSGGGEEKIAPGAAAALVRESRAVEARLAAGDPCSADRHAGRLLILSGQAIEADLVPVELAAELRTRAARLSAAVTCPPPPRPAAKPAPTAQPPEEDEGEGDRDRGDGKGRGKKKGHEQ
jgi:hypothetical protein